MSKQKDFGRPEKPLEKTREIHNEARISKKAEMKRKFNMRHPAKLFNILAMTLELLYQYQQIFLLAQRNLITHQPYVST